MVFKEIQVRKCYVQCFITMQLKNSHQKLFYGVNSVTSLLAAPGQYSLM